MLPALALLLLCIIGLCVLAHLVREDAPCEICEGSGVEVHPITGVPFKCRACQK